MNHGHLAVLSFALLLGACRHTAHDARGNIARSGSGAPLVTLAAVDEQETTRDVALPDLGSKEWTRVADAAVLEVRELRLVPGLENERGQPTLRVSVSEASANELRAWSSRHVDHEVVFAIGAGIVARATLRSALDDGFLLPLRGLSRPQQLWVLEYLTGRPWTLDELRAAVDSARSGEG